MLPIDIEGLANPDFYAEGPVRSTRRFDTVNKETPVTYRSMIAAALLCLVSTPCFAFQSGSRNAAPRPSASSTPPAVQSFSQPVQSFAQPTQSFAQPVQSFTQPTQQFAQPVQQFTQPVQSFGQSTQSVVQPTQSFAQPQAFSSPQMQTPVMQAQTASGSGVAGIPDSSLVDPVFQISDPSSFQSVDHTALDRFLSRYLVTDSVGINRIRYAQVSCQDRCELGNYLGYLQSVDTRTLNRNEQLAFWFNLYNAKTIAVVMDNYPIRSVRQIKQKFTDFVGPFDDEGAVTVLGKPLSLNDIESGIVRPVWQDPRIHYALNCASYGCPSLATTAWTAQNLDGRLNSAAWQYINSGRAVKQGVFGLRLSKIYKWYSSDFGENDEAVLNHIRQYADPQTCRTLSSRGRISGYFYDWSLNDAKVLRRRLLEAVIR